MAMSPLVMGGPALVSVWPKADSPSASKPAPTVAAPAATVPFFKNVRRFVLPANTLTSFFIDLSSFRLDFGPNQTELHNKMSLDLPRSWTAALVVQYRPSDRVPIRGSVRCSAEEKSGRQAYRRPLFCCWTVSRTIINFWHIVLRA